MRSLVLGFFLLCFACLSSCGLFVQDSVTFHGTQCSDSRFWLVSDALLTGTFVYLAGENDAPAESYIPAVGLAGSAVAGWYKRKNCIQHRRGASPEEYARDAERARKRDEAQMRAMQRLGQGMQQGNAQPSGNSSGGRATSSTSSTSTRSTSQQSVTHTVHRASDEVGKSCSSANNTDRSIPTAGTCKYGALCSMGRCTLRCRSSSDCPGSMQCGWSEGDTKMQICR